MARPKKTREICIPDSVKCLQPVELTPSGKGIYADNPFISAGRFSITTSTKGEIIGQDLTITDKQANEIASGAIVRQRIVDSDQFVKLYSKNIALFFEMSQTAQKTLIAVILAVQDQSKNKAEIFLSYQQALNYYDQIKYDKPPSKVMFSRGIGQLIDYDFLAIHWRKQGWYWINPNIVFNGDRMAFIDLYVQKRKIERIEDENNYFSKRSIS